MLTVRVHSIGIRFRIGYPHRADRLDAFVDGRALFGFGLTGFGVVSALDIHIGRNGFAYPPLSNRSPLGCTGFRVALAGDIHTALTESMHRVSI
ncbi:hypothetical protein [Burkholderia ambifaria]|uniref:hypothetical protein n=1 Tax=Burkholderia ambifaria TaxID=152480 RepID=UPI0015896CE4|nr:hypothetical protein [Burkholderia ambifaria]